MEPMIYKPGTYNTPGVYKGAGGVYNGRGVYNDGAGGGYKPEGTFTFSNFTGLSTEGTATISNFNKGGRTYTKVSNPSNFIVKLLGMPFDFKKITLDFWRQVYYSGSKNSKYIEFSLLSSDDEILITRPNNSLSDYNNQNINVPSGISYNILNGFINANGGKDFICSNSSYWGNSTHHEYIIEKNKIKVSEIGKGTLGEIQKGLSDFIGFKFNEEPTSNQNISVSEITLTIEQ